MEFEKKIKGVGTHGSYFVNILMHKPVKYFHTLLKCNALTKP